MNRRGGKRNARHPFNPLDVATHALRLGSASVLKEGLVGFMRASEGTRLDYRDVMVGLAPLHDCARRMGLDVEALFAEAASEVGGEVGDIARRFGTRTDVTPQAFLYVVTEEPDGPIYSWVE